MEKCIKNSKICMFGGDFKEYFGYHFSYPIEENYDDPSRDDYVPINLSSVEKDFGISASSYPIEENYDDPSRDDYVPINLSQYNPFAYSASRGDRVEPMPDIIDSTSEGLSFNLSTSYPFPLINDLIPISRLSTCISYTINLPSAHQSIPISRLAPSNYPYINDLIPISRFSSRGDRVEPVYLCDSLEDYSHTVWDPYLHDYVPEYSKPNEQEIPTPKGPYYPPQPTITERPYASERCFC